MTAMNFVDPTLHVSSFPATYVAPGLLQWFGVSATPGSTTGTLPTTPQSGVYGGNTYTVLSANVDQNATADCISGYFTGNGNLTVIPIGFAPTWVEIIDWTAGTTWKWMLGAPSTDALKITNAPAVTVDTGSAIVDTADAAGGLGDVTYIALSATLCVNAHVISFRIEC